MSDNPKKKALDRKRRSKQPWEQRYKKKKGSALWIYALALLGALAITGAYVWGWIP